jgi:hypothetical protein
MMTSFEHYLPTHDVNVKQSKKQSIDLQIPLGEKLTFDDLAIEDVACPPDDIPLLQLNLVADTIRADTQSLDRRARLLQKSTTSTTNFNIQRDFAS